MSKTEIAQSILAGLQTKGTIEAAETTDPKIEHASCPSPMECSGIES